MLQPAPPGATRSLKWTPHSVDLAPFRLAGVLGVCFLLTALSTRGQDLDSIPKAESPVRGNREKGKLLYDKYGCYECHGRQGQGSVLSGPRLGPNPGSFSGFVAYIRQPSGQMPPYTRKITTDAELADMYAFLGSLSQPPDVTKIPLLQSLTAEGKRR